MQFLDAYGLVGIACALQTACESHPDFHVVAPESATVAGHLTHMGLRDLLRRYGLEGVLPESPTAVPSEAVVPLQSAKEAGGEERISRLIWGQLEDHVSPQVLAALAEGLSEMVANALEHSGEDAQVMAQVYSSPRGKAPDHDDRVQVVIGDIGRGIRQSFLKTGARDPIDDREAIDDSLQYLVSSVTDDAGRGQGLSTTMEQVVGLRGKMVVRSGKARVSIDPGGQHWEQAAPLRGVIVALGLPLFPG